MGCFVVLPAFFLAIFVLALVVSRAAPALAELWATLRPPPGELETLELFARAHGGVLEVPRRFLVGPRTLDGARVACKVGERRAWLEVAGHGPFRVRASVDVDPALELEIRRPTFFRRRGSARMATQLDAAPEEQPDVRFHVERARDARGEVRESLFVHGGEALTTPLARLLYETGVDAVRASGGQLAVAFEVPRLVTESAGEVLRDLEAVARAYARRPAPVALGGVVERYLWLEGNAPRCPYCHVDIAEGEADLVACERCRTLHHAACFAEHGSCTLLGCGGGATVRASA